MSASGTRELLEFPHGVQQVAREFCGVEISIGRAEQLIRTFGRDIFDDRAGWTESYMATSAGPVVWLKNRLRQAGLIGVGLAVDDGWVEVIQPQFRARKRTAAVIGKYARSRMFTTMQITEPINLTSGKVAGLACCLFVRK